MRNCNESIPQACSYRPESSKPKNKETRRGDEHDRLTYSKQVNCITELLPAHAIERSRYLDSLPEPAGPLHGLPVSVKEQFGFKGKINNNGFVVNCNRMQTNACTLNDALEDGCGAVIFARTTQPQSVMHLETNSNIYGRTVNPWNASLTAGGSSGGEGALVGFKASPLVKLRCPSACRTWI